MGVMNTKITIRMDDTQDKTVPLQQERYQKLRYGNDCVAVRVTAFFCDDTRTRGMIAGFVQGEILQACYYSEV